LKSKNDTLQVTAIKRAQDDEDVILRLFNPSEKEIEGEVFVTYNLGKVYYVNLKEEVIEEIRDREENKFRLNVKPKEIATLKLKIDRKDILIKKEEVINAKREEIQLLNDKSNFKINLDEFIPVPLLTTDDIANEEKRLKKIERKLSQIQEEAARLENKVKKYEGSDPVYLAELEFKLHKTIGYIKTYHRAALEAKLSVLLSRKKYLETYNKNVIGYTQSVEEIEKILREIGYDLNEARVKKRAYEYIIEYYQYRLKLISKTSNNDKRIN
jgi:mannosylglycerate hydrolase